MTLPTVFRHFGRKLSKWASDTDPFQLGVFLFLLTFAVSRYIYRMKGTLFIQDYGIPLVNPKGVDFRFVYANAQALRNGISEFLKMENNYPPLVTVLFLPFTFLPVDCAYLVFSLLIVGSFVFLIHWASGFYAFSRDRDRYIFTFLATVILFESYPILFAIERGNSDLVAMAFAVLALASMSKKKFFSATVFLTLATQIKIYPAILAIFLLLSGGWAYISLFFLLNVSSLFVLGPSALISFLDHQNHFMTHPFIWPTNHAAVSFAQILFEKGSIDFNFVKPLIFILAGVPSGIFLAFSLLEWVKKTKSKLLRGALFGMACQLMCLIPSTSHDYKLGIQIAPFLVMLGLLHKNEKSFNRWGYAPVFFTAFLTALIFAPASHIPKTLFIFLLFFAYAAIAFREVWASLIWKKER